MAIYYRNRNSNKTIEEKVAGVKYLKWLSDSYCGKLTLKFLIRKKLFSVLYGKLQDSKYSKRKIKDFVDNFGIDMSEALRENINDYKHFNDFFTRKLKKESRKIDASSNVLVSPADSKVFAYENIDINNLIQVKGSYYSLYELLGNDKKQAEKYNNGSLFIFRLCPTDYHRFHFPDSGRISKVKKISGEYYSVNPISLSSIPKVYCSNKRHISTLDSDNFKDICIIEVGATCVGTIEQTYTKEIVGKGDEKGYFKFGGSTVIMLLEENVIKIDDDLIQNTNEGIETSVFMGEKIGMKV
ncbi:phosphatidylserine decarboxylase [Clostridiaceae bacterium M8S5]|nr:phosphatidylserine decarboxylase [Clostridiaceae bacterium M8S5]